MQQKKLRSRTPELFTLFQRDFLPAWPLILLRAYPRAGWSRPLMRPGPKNNPFGAHRPKKNAPSGTLPKPKKLPRPASPNRKIAPSGAPPGRMVSSSGALSDQKKTSPPAHASTGRPLNRRALEPKNLPGPGRSRAGWSRRPVHSPTKKNVPASTRFHRQASQPARPRTGWSRLPVRSPGRRTSPGRCAPSSDASPGGRSAAARYRVVPGSRW